MSIGLTWYYKLSPSKYDPWEVTQWFQHFFSTDHSSNEVIFRKCVQIISYNFFLCFPLSQNDHSTSISTQERGRICTELDLGCREDVEVRECFSSPEILELKAQCELVHYCGAAPGRLQCQFGLTGPVFEVVQDISVEGVINCLSWRYKFFVHNAMAVEKTITIVFTLDLLIRAFFGRGELFVCHSALCRLVSGSQSNTRHSSPVITLSKKIWFNFESQILTNFQPVHFLLNRQVFHHYFCTNFSHVQTVCKNSKNCIFIQARFSCSHPDTQSGIFHHHSLRNFHILIIC